MIGNIHTDNQRLYEIQWACIFSRPVTITGLQSCEKADTPSQCGCSFFTWYLFRILYFHLRRRLFEFFLFQKLHIYYIKIIHIFINNTKTSINDFKIFFQPACAKGHHCWAWPGVDGSRNWFEPVRLWLGLVGFHGSGQTPIFVSR